MNSPQYYRNKVWSLNSAAQDYENMGRIHLARLWRYLASYYVVLGNEQDTSEYDQYGNLETLVKRIDRLVDDSLPRNISKRSAGGFGYHGDTPIGENWAIVYTYAPNIASLLEDSNWECFLKESESFDDSDYTVERFSSWITPTENLMVRMIDDSGKPTAIAVKVVELLQRLEGYPVLNEDHWSSLASESEYNEQVEVIQDVINDNWLVPDNDLPKIWNDRTNKFDKLETVIWNWLYENDHQALDRASYGYSDSGGYGLDEIAVLGSLYALNALDKSAYDESEWETLEESLADYAWKDINSAFRGWESKL